MTTTTAPTEPFASDEDVRLVLGPMGSTTPSDILTEAGIDVEEQIPRAHAETLDKLTEVYGPVLPTIAGDALEAARWAEASLCAANILDILRASLDTDSEIPERLRRTAWDTLGRYLPGLRPGDPEDPGAGAILTRPVHSSSTPVSNFPNPYGDDEPVDITGGWSSL
jgi:hypothetical protein